MPTAFEGFKSGNTIIPCKDVTAFPRSEQAVLGAVNALKNNLVSITASDITYTVVDGVVTVSALTANKVLTVGQIFKEALGNTANVKLVGCPFNGAYDKYFMWWGIRNADDTGWIESGRDEGQGAILNIKDVNYSYIKVEIEVKVSQDYTLPLIFKPMITPNLNATYADFVPHAMTNKELTEKVARSSGTIATGYDYERFGGFCLINVNAEVTLTANTWTVVESNLPFRTNKIARAWFKSGDGTKVIQAVVEDIENSHSQFQIRCGEALTNTTIRGQIIYGIRE